MQKEQTEIFNKWYFIFLNIQKAYQCNKYRSLKKITILLSNTCSFVIHGTYAIYLRNKQVNARHTVGIYVYQNDFESG